MTIDLGFMRLGTSRRHAEEIENLEHTAHYWMVRALWAEESQREAENLAAQLTAERDAAEQRADALRQAAAVQPVRPVLALSFPEHEEMGRQPLVRVGTLWDLQGRRSAA